jgi:LmbE family N-acetylglucosaminyl deacetylase
MRTLIIAAHMDDEALSTGALVVRRIREGGEVFVLTVYGRVYEYGKETVDESYAEQCLDFMQAKEKLGYQLHRCMNLTEGEPAQVGYYKILERIEGVLSTFSPHEVVIPSASDMNQDHKFLNHACKIALRPANLQGVVRILEAHAFDGIPTSANYFIPMTANDLMVKLIAIEQYRREARSGVHPRSMENIEAVHKVIGAKCGHKYAEGYTLNFLREV